MLADTSAHARNGPKAGWNPGDDFYNDLAWTAEFVRDHGVTRFETFDILRDAWSRLRDIDLVLSFLAVGFHFPVENVMPRLLEVTTRLHDDLRSARWAVFAVVFQESLSGRVRPARFTWPPRLRQGALLGFARARDRGVSPSCEGSGI